MCYDMYFPRQKVEEESGEPEESFLLQHHPAECECRLCQGLVPVAIKVLHPGIVRRSIRDLDVLHLLAGFVQLFVPWMSWWRPATCVDEFGDRLHRMINLKREAIALERFNFNFVANPNVRSVELGRTELIAELPYTFFSKGRRELACIFWL